MKRKIIIKIIWTVITLIVGFSFIILPFLYSSSYGY